MSAYRRETWCGVTGNGHTVTNCADCNRLRMQAYRRSHPSPNRPACAVCGVARGNSLGVKVYRYALIRPTRRGSRCIGSIPICDRCVVEYGTPGIAYMRAHGGAQTFAEAIVA